MTAPFRLPMTGDIDLRDPAPAAPPKGPSLELTLAQQANDAIAKGADPKAVSDRLGVMVKHVRANPDVAAHGAQALASGADPGAVTGRVWEMANAPFASNHGAGGSWGETLGDKARGMVNAVGNGLTGNFADEINAKFEPGDYQQNLTRERAEQSEFKRLHPVANFVGEGGGAILNPVFGKLGMIAGGAAYGGLAGAGAGDGSLQDRAGSAAGGAAAGALTGAALQHVVAPLARVGADAVRSGVRQIAPAAKAVAAYLEEHPIGLTTQDVSGGASPATAEVGTLPPNAIRNRGGAVQSARNVVSDLTPETPDARAKRLILDRLGSDKTSLDALKAKLAQSDKPLSLADLAGDNTMGLARGARSVPSDAKDAIPKAIYQRAEGQSSRVRGDLESAAGVGPGDVYAKADELIAQQKANARPAYEKAYGAPAIGDADVLSALDHPTFQEAYDRGRRIAKLEGTELPDLRLAKKTEGGLTLDADARDGAGKLRRDLSNVSDEALHHEWNRLAELNASDEAGRAGVLESNYRGDFEELPRAEKYGHKGKEDLPDADGTVDPERLLADNKTLSDYNRAQVVRRARESAMQRINGELSGRQAPTDFDFGMNDAGGKPPLAIPTQGIDYMKRGLDDLIESKMRGGTMGRTEARALRNKLRDVIGRVDEINPDYKTARGTFAGDQELRDALEQGREFSKTDDRVVAKTIADLSPSAKALYAQGALDDLTQQIRGTPDGQDAVRRVFGNDLKRKALQSLVGDEAFQKLEASLGDDVGENRMLRTKRFVLGGSNTVDKAQEALDLERGGIPSAVLHAARGKLGAAGADLGQSVLLNHLRGVTGETASALAPRLTAGMNGDRNALESVIQELSEYRDELARRQATQAAATRPLTSAAGGLAGALLRHNKR